MDNISASQHYDSSNMGYDSGGGISVNTGFGSQEGGNAGSSSSYASGSGSIQKTSFFSNPSQSKYEDLKQMLESNKEVPKLEAMKRIITMVAKGRSAESARELFPHVVKNVVTKNSELKKLVYLYLTRYAEQEQDLALLSIATFQHALKDPNPLIRGSAIRVLSSIRVPMISPIMLIAIKDCANDMSPYVRKTAAHAIPKLYSLDSDIKDDIIDIIAKLISDKVSLVLGSAVAAFEEVCPDRFDLIHENYRKLCSLLVDVDEWGQIIIINMLLRYARTQFVDPNIPNRGTIDPDHSLLIRCVKPLLQSRNSGVVLAVIQLYLSIAPQLELTAQLVRPLLRLLHSHREIQLIILKNIVTLTSAEFNDRFCGVNGTSFTADSYGNAKNVSNGSKMKPKVKENSEEDDESDAESVPSVPFGQQRRSIKSLFDPHLKSFFVKAKDSTQTKIFKLEILTNLSNSGNISLILREFQAYILNYQDDLEFMSATIESIGKCASRIKEIAPICLNGLVSLLSNRNESIVAQSIVVIRSQIINKDHTIISMIVRQIVKLMEKISTPQARATIVWIVAEFCSRNDYARKVAPDVLRKIAKSFANENDLVKLQALNLAAKLHITFIGCGTDVSGSYVLNLDRLKLLINYVFNLAKYDLNYDVRDRGRFLRQLLNDQTLARQILLIPKLVPNVSQGAPIFFGNAVINGEGSAPFLPTTNLTSADSGRYRVGTLSHFLGKKASEYQELPDWPQVPPDPSVRRTNVAEKPAGSAIVSASKAPSKINQIYPADKSHKNGFLSENSEESESEFDDEDEEGDEEDDVENDDDEEEEEEEDEEEEEYEVKELDRNKSETESEIDDEEEDEEEEEESIDDEESEVSESEDNDNSRLSVKGVAGKVPQKSKSANIVTNRASRSSKANTPNVDLLLDLGDLSLNETSTAGAVNSQVLAPILPTLASALNLNSPAPPFRTLESAEHLSFKEFLLIELPYNFKVNYRFPRINEHARTLVELIIKNELPEDSETRTNRIQIQAPTNGSVQFKNLETQDDGCTASIQLLSAETRLVTLSIDFNESPSLGIEIVFNRSHTTKLIAPVGDIMNPVRFNSIETFQAERSKLTGMNEIIFTVKASKAVETIREKIDLIILSLANLCSNSHLRSTTPTMFHYSGSTLKFKSLTLVTIEILSESEDNLKLRGTVNCEKMVLGSILSKLIKDECVKQL